MIQDHNLAIPNPTIPKQDILGPFLGHFHPFLGQKYQQVNGFDLKTHIPLTDRLSRVEKFWSHPLGNSKKIILVQQTCVVLSFGVLGLRAVENIKLYRRFIQPLTGSQSYNRPSPLELNF